MAIKLAGCLIGATRPAYLQLQPAKGRFRMAQGSAGCSRLCNGPSPQLRHRQRAEHATETRAGADDPQATAAARALLDSAAPQDWRKVWEPAEVVAMLRQTYC